MLNLEGLTPLTTKDARTINGGGARGRGGRKLVVRGVSWGAVAGALGSGRVQLDLGDGLSVSAPGGGAPPVQLDTGDGLSITTPGG